MIPLLWSPPGAWVEQALCAQTDPEVWFPAPGHTEGERRAKAICAGCPVRTECLTHALDIGAEHGVWGGLSPRQRQSLRRREWRGRRQPIRHGTEAGAKQHQRRGEIPCDACLTAASVADRERRHARRIAS